jgi:hypothetical protein
VSGADFITPQEGSGLKRFRVEVTGPKNHAWTVESLVTNIPGAAGES